MTHFGWFMVEDNSLRKTKHRREGLGTVTLGARLPTNERRTLPRIAETGASTPTTVDEAAVVGVVLSEAANRTTHLLLMPQNDASV